MPNYNLTIGPKVKWVLFGVLAVALILGLVAMGADDIVMRVLDIGERAIPGGDGQ